MRHCWGYFWLFLAMGLRLWVEGLRFIRRKFLELKQFISSAIVAWGWIIWDIPWLWVRNGWQRAEGLHPPSPPPLNNLLRLLLISKMQIRQSAQYFYCFGAFKQFQALIPHSEFSFFKNVVSLGLWNIFLAALICFFWQNIGTSEGVLLSKIIEVSLPAPRISTPERHRGQAIVCSEHWVLHNALSERFLSLCVQVSGRSFAHEFQPINPIYKLPLRRVSYLAVIFKQGKLAFGGLDTILLHDTPPLRKN